MIKELARSLAPEPVLRLGRTLRSMRPVYPRNCNICGFNGYFRRFGHPPRADAQCPKCKSLERHRLFVLALNSGDLPVSLTSTDNILHFAPEPCLEPIFRTRFDGYKTADLLYSADLKLNMEDIELPNASQHCVIANHVLEHVDDLAAAKEIARILKPGGVLLCMVPIVDGWETTFEDPAYNTDELRSKYFGQWDHVRYYGRDFRDRIMKGGLKLVTEITAGGEEAIAHSLVRGQKVFVFQK